MISNFLPALLCLAHLLSTVHAAGMLRSERQAGLAPHVDGSIIPCACSSRHSLDLHMHPPTFSTQS